MKLLWLFVVFIELLITRTLLEYFDYSRIASILKFNINLIHKKFVLLSFKSYYSWSLWCVFISNVLNFYRIIINKKFSKKQVRTSLTAIFRVCSLFEDKSV